jgi:hypothetical protein
MDYSLLQALHEYCKYNLTAVGKVEDSIFIHSMVWFPVPIGCHKLKRFPTLF